LLEKLAIGDAAILGENIMALSTGKQTQTVNLDETSFQVYTYRPPGEIKGLLLAFHGDGRDASGMRDAAVKIADEKGYAVVAPLFDTDRFDNEAYQQGGILDNGRLVTDRDDWTVARTKDFAEWGAAQAGLDVNDPTVLFGHSAGGQFVSRVAAFAPDDSLFDGMIVANPSTHVWPSLSEKAANGFGGGYFSQAESEALLKDYLADPVTIYLGDKDTGSVDLARGAAAMRQGDDRLERGLKVFEAAKAEAEARGWEFGWELVTAPGVGHTFGGMLRSSAMRDAIDTETPVHDSSAEFFIL
jgi:dienelactone hydrolase